MTNLRAACTLLILLGGAVATVADDCGSESDCKTAPGNINGATAVAGGGAVIGVAIAVGAGRKPKPKDDPVVFDPAGGLLGDGGEEKPEEPKPEEKPDETGPSSDDLFGPGTKPFDAPLGEDPPRPDTDPVEPPVSDPINPDDPIEPPDDPTIDPPR